ncbi:MAG: Nif3-like dinuclear metal center hexameric protein [Armatimonadota bacterium]
MTAGSVVRFLHSWFAGRAPEILTRPYIHIGSAERRVHSVALTPALTRLPDSDPAPDMVLCCRPVLPHGMCALDESEPEGRLACDIVRRGLTVCVLGECFEAAKGGASDRLAAELLQLGETAPLRVLGHEQVFKLVVFTPPEALQAAIDALAGAGAGLIGRYSHCTFRSPGIGTYLPLEGASPYAGEVGRLEQAEEYRLEVLVPRSALDAAVEAMLSAHPYEEVAYDVYPLAGGGGALGRGRTGILQEPTTAGELSSRLNCSLAVGTPDALVQRVAVVAGSLEREDAASAVAAGVNCLVAGRASSEALYCAESASLPVLEIGWASSLRPGLRGLAEVLHARFEGISFMLH